MKIEVGKSYINARGDIVKILEKQLDTVYPYICEDYSYTPQGIRIIWESSPYDLICEVVPYLYEQYISGYISQREFIEKHIKHWTENEQTNL